ncbi:MAG: hypothetical protein HY842_13310 [Bacteroidetes bacterium]|nr:hypothetical protein [Bacteroidota bacterium]
MKSNKIFYSLCVDDIQQVALETWNVTLCKEDIIFLQDKIADSIAWFEIIEDNIRIHKSELKTTFSKVGDDEEE